MSTINLLELIPDDRIKIIGAADLQLERLPALVYPDEADAENAPTLPACCAHRSAGRRR